MTGLLFAAAALAWEPLPQGDWSWQDDPVDAGFVVATGAFHDAPGGAVAWEAAIRAGAAGWRASSADVAVRVAGPGDGVLPSWDGEALVTWDPGAFGGTVLAWASVWSDERGLVDCDVTFQGRFSSGAIAWSVDPDGAGSGEWDAARIAMHELGHCLGLGHTLATGAVMTPVQPRGTGPASLFPGDDDEAGLVALYGARTGPSLLVDALAIDDADGGDGDGLLEEGESARLSLTVVNVGVETAHDVTASIVGAEDLVVEVGSEALGAVLPGDAVTGAGALVVALPPCEVDHAAALDVALADGAGRTWSAPLAVRAWCGAEAEPALVAETVGVDDDASGSSDGDGDGLAERGERVVVAIRVDNEGPVDAVGVRLSATADPARAQVLASTSTSFGVPSGGSAAGWVLLHVGPGCVPGDLDVSLRLDAADGRAWTPTVLVPVGCEEPGDTGDTGDAADTADNADTADTGDTGDAADTADTGDTGDAADTGDTADTADTADIADTADTADTGSPSEPPEALGCGCAAAPRPTLGALALALAALARRQRSRTATASTWWVSGNISNAVRLVIR